MEKQKVCIVGAGISGICAAIKLSLSLPEFEFCIFDENEDFGGTWFLQKYPNCRVDTPSHLYSFSFEQNPHWSSLFCDRNEILKYLQSVAKKYGLYNKVRFNHVVEELRWKTENKSWLVSTKNTQNGNMEQFEFDFVIAGPGPFRVPNYPEIFKNFTGPILHSTNWRDNIELKDKTVLVIGSGATAVQLIPGIINDVKKLYSFQRSPAWVMAKPDAIVPSWIQDLFKEMPIIQWIFRFCLFCVHMLHFLGLRKGSIGNWVATQLSKRHLNKQIGDKNLSNLLLPNYPFGARRVCLTNDFYPALSDPSRAEVIVDEISDVKGNSIEVKGGRKIRGDVLILATGFQQLGQGYFCPSKVFVDNGKDLMPYFRKDPRTYVGIMPENLPNFFFLWGPNTAASNNSSILTIEAQMDWIVKVLKKMVHLGCKQVEAKKGAVDKYMETLEKNMKDFVFGSKVGKIKPWALDETGKNTAQYPGGFLSYWLNICRVKEEDLNMY